MLPRKREEILKEIYDQKNNLLHTPEADIARAVLILAEVVLDKDYPLADEEI